MDLSNYVGLPFVDHGRGPEAFDCWGLYRWVTYYEFDIDLPSYSGAYSSSLERAEVAALIRGESLGWQDVTGQERAGDMVVLRLNGDPWHVGLVVTPGEMLHIHRKTDSIIERYDRILWRHRVQQILRPCK